MIIRLSTFLAIEFPIDCEIRECVSTECYYLLDSQIKDKINNILFRLRDEINTNIPPYIRSQHE
jgi:hypothetical protein